MVSVPRLLIIAERGYCSSDAHWLEQITLILDILDRYPTVAIQLRNKYAQKSWQIVASHIERWMKTHPNQCVLNGLGFPAVSCARHLPESDLHLDTKPIICLRGGSVHSVTALNKAIQVGCHYVQYGAVFPTSKPVVPTGVKALQDLCTMASVPVLAVGGISTGKHIRQCLSAGAYGVSIGSWIMQTQSPVRVIDQIREEISQFMSNL